MMKRFKNFKEDLNSYENEWGNINEDNKAKKNKVQKIRCDRKKKEDEKFSAFD
jgi:hypothetical protein